MAAGFGGIDFSPEPAYGSNPFEPVKEGISLGFGMAQQIREAKKAEMDAKNQRFDRGLKAFTLLSDKSIEKELSLDTKEKIFKSAIPFLTDTLGFQVKPEEISLKNVDPSDIPRISSLIVKNADPRTGSLKYPDIVLNEINIAMENAYRKGNAEDVAFLDKLAGNIKAGSAGDEQRQFRQENKTEERIKQYRSAITSSKPYNNYVETKNRTDALEQAASDPGAFGDLGILFDYMRSLDPDSVVREGEQLMFRRTGSLSDKAANALNSLVTGKTLLPSQREEILKYAKYRRDISERSYAAHVEPTLKQAKRLGLNEEEIDPFYVERKMSKSNEGAVKAGNKENSDPLGLFK